MNRHRHGISAYQSSLRTVPPLQAIVMLYDGAISRTAVAAEAARRGDYETQFNEIMRAAEILNGLNMCLDMGAGGRIARSLREMYQAVCKAMLSGVGRKNGAECCERIIEALRLTRDAWAEIARNGTAASPTAGPALARSMVG